MRQVSPGMFGVIQFGGTLLPPVLVPIGVVYLLARFLPAPGGPAGWFAYALMGGGLPVLYLMWLWGQLWSGLVATPRHPWRLEVAGAGFTIQTKKLRASVPFAAVRSFTLVDDESWDQLQGMEDRCLLVRLRSGLRISIPGSSAGFSETLAAAREQFDVATVDLAE